jgi:hypothetical protein
MKTENHIHHRFFAPFGRTFANTLADQLWDLQDPKNGFVGVSCVRTICTYLRMGEIRSAAQVAVTEGDKIRQYPDIVQKIRDDFLDQTYLTLDFFRS